MSRLPRPRTLIVLAALVGAGVYLFRRFHHHHIVATVVLVTLWWVVR